ncbi:hypothetical protein Poly59_33820 [Rubripirellula reticaptiva]|uniref:Uncharacterized protein n=1 Tax=Rubripirellula reticaptiva TaxID=2528013 RepID=A0A5C6EUL3_9BACT|nr:hypothetical protein Poly59_33820 [Rubripirellula reticaptiva]
MSRLLGYALMFGLQIIQHEFVYFSTGLFAVSTRRWKQAKPAIEVKPAIQIQPQFPFFHHESSGETIGKKIDRTE